MTLLLHFVKDSWFHWVLAENEWDIVSQWSWNSIFFSDAKMHDPELCRVEYWLELGISQTYLLFAWSPQSHIIWNILQNSSNYRGRMMSFNSLLFVAVSLSPNPTEEWWHTDRQTEVRRPVRPLPSKESSPWTSPLPPLALPWPPPPSTTSTWLQRRCGVSIRWRVPRPLGIRCEKHPLPLGDAPKL